MSQGPRWDKMITMIHFTWHSFCLFALQSNSLVKAKSGSQTLIPAILIKKLKDSTSAVFSNSENQCQNITLQRGWGANWPTEQLYLTGCGGADRYKICDCLSAGSTISCSSSWICYWLSGSSAVTHTLRATLQSSVHLPTPPTQGLRCEITLRDQRF